MTQQYIDFGSFPDDPSADSIRESFQKTQDNFTDLYTNSLKQGVMELVPGAGLTTVDDRITGNLVINADIPYVTIKTTPSLIIKPEGSGAWSSSVKVTDTTPFVIGLAPNLTTTNANFSGTIQTANLKVTGLVKTNLIPDDNEVYDLGSPSHRWRDLYLSGQTLTIGTQTISSGADGFEVSAGLITSNLSVGTVEADFVGGQLTTPDQPSITSVGILTGLSVQGDINTGSISVNGDLDSYSVNAATMSVAGIFTAGTITGNIVLPPGATLDAPGGSGANMSVMFNDGGKAAAVPGLSYNKTTSLLTIQGNVEGGNLVTSGAMSVTKTATVGNLSTSGNVAATGNINGGNLISLGILSASSTITGGNLTTGGYLTVTGDASIGNITTTNVNGVQVSVSGNVSGANLVASGILKVDGAANVGSLTTTGLVSAATLQASGNANISGNINTTNGNIVTTNGKIAGGSLYSTGLADITGDILGRANVTTNGLLTVLGNSSLGNVSSSGNLTVSANATIGNISTTSVSVSGNIGGGNLIIAGILRAGDSNMANVNATGSMTVTGTHTAGNLSTGGNLTVTANANLGNIGTTGIISADGNITGGNIKTGLATMFANGSISGAGIAVTGTLSGANATVTSNLSSGNVFANTGTIQSDLLKGNSVTIVNDVTSGNMYANSGMINANVVGGNSATISGNVTGGNLKTGGATIYANGYISGANASLATVVGTLFQGNGANLTNLNSSVISTTILITAAAGTGSVVTLTYSSLGFTPFYVGQTITVSGVSPTQYNGTFTVLTASTTQVTYSHTATGAMAIAGSIAGGSRSLSAQNADTAVTAVTASTVTASAQPSITSLGTLTSLSLSGSISGATSISGSTITGGNLSATGFFIHGVETSISASGTTQGTGYVLSKEFNVISTATASINDSVRLPGAVAGLNIVIVNASSSAIKVYPASGSTIDRNGQDAPAILGVDGKLVLFSTSATQWYSLTTIYA